MRKTGLHKKVSSIFGEAAFSDEPVVKTPPADNDAASATKTEPAKTELPASIVDSKTARPQYQHHTPVAGPVHKTVTKTASALTEDQEYDAAQRKKLYLVFGLAAALAIVFFFNFYQPGKKTAAVQDTASVQISPMTISEIYWPEPELWPADIRDPMIFNESAAKSRYRANETKGPFALKGIVQQPDGRSMALLGTEILYVGDEIDGWTVKEVLKDAVRLEKADGEKLELKMKGR